MGALLGQELCLPHQIRGILKSGAVSPLFEGEAPQESVSAITVGLPVQGILKSLLQHCVDHNKLWKILKEI